MSKEEHSLRRTLLQIIFVPLSVLSAILVALFIVSAWLLLDEIEGRQKQISQDLANQANLYLQDTLDLTRLSAQRLSTLAPAQKARFIQDVHQLHPHLTALYLLDDQGLVASESTSGLSLIGLDLSREAIVQQMYQERATAVSAPFISPTTGQAAVTIATPVWDDGYIQQVLMTELNLIMLQQAIETVNASTDSISFIVDASGSLVAYPDAHWVQERRNLKHVQLVQSGLRQEDDFQVFHDALWQQWMLGRSSPMHNGWAVFIIQPLTSSAQPLLLLIAISLFGFGGGLLVLSWLIQRGVARLTKPITFLVQDAERLSHGQYEPPPQRERQMIRELDILRRNFDRMVDTVIQRDRLLEQRVADRTHRLQTIASISAHLNATLDPAVLLDTVVEQIHSHFGYPFVSIFILDEHNQLVIRSASGAAGQAMLAENYSIAIDAPRSLIAAAARSGQIINLTDVNTVAEYLPCAYLPGTCSEMCLPIISNQQVIGVVDVQVSGDSAFEASEVAMFHSLANQIGVSLHKAELYTQMEQLVVRRTGELLASNRGLQNELTERQRIEDALRQSQAELHAQAKQMREIMNAVPEGVLLLQADGQPILTNPAADEILELLLPTGAPTDQHNPHPLTQLLSDVNGENWRELQLGKRILQITTRVLVNGSEQPRWVMVIRDETAAREAQRQAQQQERLAAVGQLAAGIAHDFNNIMAVILLYVDIMLNISDLEPRHRERLNTIAQQARRAAELIQQILDFSRRAVLERRPMDLLPLIKEQVKLLQRTLPEHIDISLMQQDAQFLVNADPTRIQQAVMNLAFNARDAMPEGGKLRIALEQISPEQREISCVTCGPVLTGEWVCIQVSDSGDGIPGDVMAHIFEPFFTTKPPGKGTGLGLAQVYGIAKQHEGHIDVSSQVGRGTVFSIYLPLVSPVPTPRISADHAGRLITGQGQLILVVEDEPVTQKAIVDSLKMLNYQTVAVANGRVALNTLASRPNAFSLVLSDVVMPEMSGIVLFRSMQQRGLQTPLVLMSGHPMKEELEQLQSEGLIGWLLKPPDIESLSSLIARAIKGSA